MKTPKPIRNVKNFVRSRRHQAIKEAVREVTAGGIIYRQTRKGVEMLLVQDAVGRWTIPKGHIEEGESPRQTAKREINEETGLPLESIKVRDWLGKNHFQYRRGDSLILMKMHVYLVEATSQTERITKEEWMRSIGWFTADKALELIEYESTSKLMLIGLSKIRGHKSKTGENHAAK